MTPLNIELVQDSRGMVYRGEITPEQAAAGVSFVVTHASRIEILVPAWTNIKITQEPL